MALTIFACGCGSRVPDEYAACTGPGQCMFAPAHCCWVCHEPTVDDVVAVNIAKRLDYREYACGDSTVCSTCAPPENSNLFAYCDAGRCAVSDVRTSPVSECQTDADCLLRISSDCCESCGLFSVGRPIAVSITASPSLTDLVCDPSDPAGTCKECPPSVPGKGVKCGADGHCALVPSGG